MLIFQNTADFISAVKLRLFNIIRLYFLNNSNELFLFFLTKKLSYLFISFMKGE